METGRVLVLLVLALCAAWSSVVVQGMSVDAKESGKVMAKLDSFCQDKCRHQQTSSDPDTCSRFCGFVAHLRVTREADVYALFREGQRNIHPLMWAMNEVVQAKLQSGEDDRAVGALFIEKAKGLYARLRDDL